MNILKNTRCYLIGGMENFQNGDGWRREVSVKLNAVNIKTFDPYLKPFVNEIKEDKEARILLNQWMIDGEYDKVTRRMREVRRDDLRCVDLSDFFIAYIHPKIASWGSAEEIFWANRLKKPIFLVVEGGKHLTPLWLLGMIADKYFYNSLDEALEVILAIDNGTKEIDSERWRLLKPEYR